MKTQPKIASVTQYIYFPKGLFALGDVQHFQQRDLKYPDAWELFENQLEYVLKLSWRKFLKYYSKKPVAKKFDVPRRIKRRKYFEGGLLTELNKRKSKEARR